MVRTKHEITQSCRSVLPLPAGGLNELNFLDSLVVLLILAASPR